MGFSYRKLTGLRPQREMWLSTFLTALGVAAAFFIPYIILGKGYFIFYGDFNVQQIPFYQMCHEAVKSGNTAWNWTTDLGANFVGSYSFYLLGSPFFWLTIPFPNWMVPYLMGPLLILKFACAALTAYCYLRRFTRSPAAARLGGLLYAFSGFSVYNIFFNHFHEAIIVFPLLLLSLELLITENKRGIFAVMVAVCAMVNYFFFFGMVVFVILYFFVRMLSGAFRLSVGRFLVLVLEAVLGVVMAAVLLVPSFYAVIENSRISSYLLGWNAIMYGKEQIYLNIIECFFFPPDIPARPVFFPGADVKWSSLGGWLPVFSMAGVFTLFITKKKSWLKRIIGICAFMALVPVLNSSFYMFNTSYYARWFYMPILMMCLATVMLAEDKTTDWSGGFKWVLGITLAFALTIGFFPQKTNDDKLIFGLYSQSDDGMYVLRFWLTCFISLIGLIMLFALIKLRKHSRRSFFRTATVCVCIISVVYGNVYIASGRSHSYEPEKVMIDQLIEGNVKLNDDSEFRIDVFDGVDNTGMYLGLPCINAFHSVVPQSIIDFYKYVGVERSVGSRPKTDVYAIRPLLSVKYLLNRTDGKHFVDDDGNAEMSGYTYLKTSGGYYVYENDNYIPYGFSYNYYMTEEFCDGYAETHRSSLMLKALLLNDEQIKKYGYTLTDIETLRVSGYRFDETTTLSFNDSAYEYDCAALAETSAVSFERDNGGFTAKVERDGDSLVFFSVPYDSGWSATVNGKKADIEKVNVGFMAVLVPSGTSTVRFNYTTPGLTLGLTVTAAGTAVFLIYFLIAYFFVKRRGNSLPYPEGDILMEHWHADELDEVRRELEQRLDDMPARSVIDDIPEIPGIGEGFDGGFRIDPSALDDENGKNSG